MITPETRPEIRLRQYATLRYIITCTLCPDLLVRAEGSHETARIIEAHRDQCEGQMVARPRGKHP